MSKFDYVSFIRSLEEPLLPSGLNDHLRALWHDRRGDWDAAHACVQDLPDRSAAHIHAYLHRKEGDIWNADYWYRRAGRQRPEVSLDEEWEQIVRKMLED
jgi:hypothetical protein